MTQLKKHTISLSYTNTSEYIFSPDEKHLKKQVLFLLDLLCDAFTEVNIRFCGSEEMQKMNKQFRGKDNPTDVLSFVPDPLIHPNPHFLGDILICIPVCQEQAKRAKRDLDAEIVKMLVHALVHLKGFDHERSESAERVMSKLERALMTELKTELKQKFKFKK